MNSGAGIESIGGKAAALMLLAKHGFNVPPFLVIEPEAFTGRGLKGDVRQALFSALPVLGCGPYAARSSALEEDGAEHSHAGQFLSLLNLKAKDLTAACNQVWRSGCTGSVGQYRKSLGLNGEGSAPAVIVQQMVDARCAGIVFTADPVSGLRDRIIVSAVEGLGDKLAGGKQDGQTYVIDSASGALLERPDDGVLTSQDVDVLHKMVLAVEKICKCPQDIEWAFDDSRLFVLQSRAITTRLMPLPVGDDCQTVFDNSNIIESFPGLVSPLTYSFAQYAYARVYASFVRMMGVGDSTIQANAAVFDNMLARIDGRVYYNLVNWYRVLAMLPGFAINRSHMETMMGVGEPLPEDIIAGIGPAPAKGMALWREWLRVGWVGLRLIAAAVTLKRTIDDFYRRLNTALAEPNCESDKQPLSVLAAEYRRIEADLLDRWDAPIINDFLCMMAFGGSRKLLEKWAGQSGLDIHNDIMIGQGDIISAEPAQRIRDMGAMLSGKDELCAQLLDGDGSGLTALPHLQAAIRAYLDKFADRCIEELKLESVPLDRDPVPLYMAIAAASNAPQSGAGKASDRNVNQALDDLFAGHPVRRLVARAAVGWAKRRVADRENLRFERTRIFGRARRLFGAAGMQFHASGVLEAPDDVFYLTVQEVLGAIEGYTVSCDLAGLVRLRKTEMVAARLLPDPPRRFTVRGAVCVGLGALEAQVPEPRCDAKSRKGTGCSAGLVLAVARIIHNPRTQTLKQGDILVARHTDPGWIAFFSNASAIVVERGSLLSHSAIVARELGIPCVVGLKGATDWIEDGEVIEVNGATGLVKKTGA